MFGIFVADSPNVMNEKSESISSASKFQPDSGTRIAELFKVLLYPDGDPQ